MTLSTAPIADIAWAAGLFEGEGCIGYWSRKCSATLVTTDRDVLDRFVAVVGLGAIEKNPRLSRVGSFAKKPQWVWRASGFEDTQAIVAAFWRWLGRRRRDKCEDVLLAGRDKPVEGKYRGYVNKVRGICATGIHAATGTNVYTNPKSGRIFCVPCRARYMSERYQRLKAANVTG